MITPTICAALDAFQQAANRGTAVHLSPELVQELRDALEAKPEGPAAPPTPETPAEALAVRPLLERVARLDEGIGIGTAARLTAISNRAAAWLRENPPGQPVAIEPRGCPTPGACSCVEPAPPAPEPGEQPVSQPYKLPESGEAKELHPLWYLVEFLEGHSSFRRRTEPTDELAEILSNSATLLQQQATELAALRGMPVALSEQEDAFMGGVCAALATVTAHGDSVIWREIVRSVGIENALNYAANVNPGDWDLAGFSKYAQPELGKDKPQPAPQAGEGEA